MNYATNYELKSEPMEHHKLGLSWTRTGYGKKIPTTRMLRFAGEKVWRRVYVMIWSNAGTAYVIVRGRRFIVTD
jgi:hypothetical protein